MADRPPTKQQLEDSIRTLADKLAEERAARIDGDKTNASLLTQVERKVYQDMLRLFRTNLQLALPGPSGADIDPGDKRGRMPQDQRTGPESTPGAAKTPPAAGGLPAGAPKIPLGEDAADANAVMKMLADLGWTDINQCLKRWTLPRIMQCIEIERARKGPRTNPGGFVRKCLEQNWQG